MLFAEDGAQLFSGAALSSLPDIRVALAHLPSDAAGHRLAQWEGVPAIDAVATRLLGPDAHPVRAILFDKTPLTNWSLGWHQDRTICVERRIEIDGFGPWSIKGGMTHVEPPFALLAGMATLRIHLDDVPSTNAPLLIAPGSHKLGKVPVGEIDQVVARCGIRACLAEAGDIWAYATPILHASKAATGAAHRRVLQVDYAAERLPGGLEWAFRTLPGTHRRR